MFVRDVDSGASTGATSDQAGRAEGLEDRLGARQTDVFGVACFRGTLEVATTLVIEAAVKRVGGYACLCNVHVLETARRDRRVMGALANARWVFPDGAPLVWIQRVVESGPAERVGGPDLMERVLRDGSARGLRHALYGSTDAVLDRLRDAIERQYPQVEIVASIAPPFGSSLNEAIASDVHALRSARPDVVWVALGAPRQELWAARYAHELEPTLVVGVGAAFEFLGGSRPRAPRWMQTLGLEWLHRLANEPRRLGPRYVNTNAQFLFRTLSTIVLRVSRRSHGGTV
jgi:N-acetylglucosaminyldiphosphoundecaprenol N-acetyl-beta-D-mannosaminyltransferase